MMRDLDLYVNVADIGSTRLKMFDITISGSQVAIDPNSAVRFDYTSHIIYHRQVEPVKFVNPQVFEGHVKNLRNPSPRDNHLIGVTGLKDALVVYQGNGGKSVAILSHPSLSLNKKEAQTRGLEVHYPGSKLAKLKQSPQITRVLFPPHGISLETARFNTLVGFWAEFIAGEEIGVPPDDHHGFGKTPSDFQALTDEFSIRPNQLKLYPALHRGIIFMGNDFRSESAFVGRMIKFGKLSKDTLVFIGDTVGKWLYWPDPNKPISGKKIDEMGYATLYRMGGLNRDVLSWFVQPLLKKNETYNRGIERILRKGLNGQYEGLSNHLYYPEAYSVEHPFGLLYKSSDDSNIEEIVFEKNMFESAEFLTELHEKIIFDMVTGLIFENIHTARHIAKSQGKNLDQFKILGTGGIFDWSRAFRNMMAKGFGEVSHFKTMPLAAVALGMRAAVESGKKGNEIYSEYPVDLVPVNIREPATDYCSSDNYAIWSHYRSNAMETKNE